MIISLGHQFVFFHNPKAGGTSVRASIERFNDIGFGMWGPEPSQTGGRMVGRAHMGVDEFARYYPDLWEKTQGARRFCLWRDPQARFLSSVSEHGKMFGDTDVRFATSEQRKAALMRIVERLSALGRAEDPAMFETFEFTHFKPQWIYAGSADGSVAVEAIPLAEIDRFFAAISQITGETVEAETRNTRESLDLPPVMAALAGSGRLRRAVAGLPGMGAVKGLLRRRYSGKPMPKGGFDLTGAERSAVEAFVRDFYAADYARFGA